MSPLRLAVLEADTPVPRTFARHGGYAGVFSYLFERAVAPEPLSSLLTITAHDVVSGGAEAYPDPDTVDAILISGSKHNAFDNDEWIVRLVDYVRDVVQNQPRIKVIGICFGHQIVGRALGAKVGRSDKGWEISVTETELTEKGKEIFGGKKTLSLQQMHRDQVFTVPDGAELLASTDRCMNQGFLIPHRVITVQGHPEFTAEIMDELLELRHESGLFTDEMFEEARARNGDHHDGVFAAQALLKFLQDR